VSLPVSPSSSPLRGFVSLLGSLRFSLPADLVFLSGRAHCRLDGFLCFVGHDVSVSALHARWGGRLFAPQCCQCPPIQWGHWLKLRQTLFCPRFFYCGKKNQTITNNIYEQKNQNLTKHFAYTLPIPHTVPDLITPRRTQHTTTSVYHMGRSRIAGILILGFCPIRFPTSLHLDARNTPLHRSTIWGVWIPIQLLLHTPPYLSFPPSLGCVFTFCSKVPEGGEHRWRDIYLPPLYRHSLGNTILQKDAH